MYQLTDLSPVVLDDAMSWDKEITHWLHPGQSYTLYANFLRLMVPLMWKRLNYNLQVILQVIECHCFGMIPPINVHHHHTI